jgi:UDPglucose 6-dehydrogenase
MDDQKEKTGERLLIEVVGAGLVGRATGTAFESWGHEVVFTDTDADVRDELAAEGHRVGEPDDAVGADLGLVSVPTPYDPEAGLIVDYVERAVDRLVGDAEAIAIRSTVPPGTTAGLADAYEVAIAMVPEFLFAKTAGADAMAVDQVVVGAGDDRVRSTVERAFAHNDPAFVEVTPTEAELVKLVSNAFGATKISFANAVWRVVSQLPDTAAPADADPDVVLDGFRQVSPWHGSDRGLTGGHPYGGACLPKDMNGLVQWARDLGIDTPQFDGTVAENDRIADASAAPEVTSRW